MKTIVVTGGTDGMGAALVTRFLQEGNRVLVVGRSQEKFDALVAGVSQGAARVDAVFIRADLSLMSEARRAIAEVKDRCARVDALVLAASYIRQRRHETAEGHEASWALFFLSKYLFVTDLADRLAAADRPVIVNTAVPGAPLDAIAFEDLELTRDFTFARSNAQQRRANELLGILAAAQNPHLSYVTWGPSRLVRTSFAGDVGVAMRMSAAVMGRLLGQSPQRAVEPILRLVADPTPGRSAFRGAQPVALVAGPDDAAHARRLASAIQP